MEENIKEKSDETFKNKITLQDERDLFVRYVCTIHFVRRRATSRIRSSAVSSAIQVMLRELDSACESAFSNMTRSSWASLKSVSGQSAYVEELIKSIEQVVETVKPLVEQKKYLRNFLDKASRFVMASLFYLSCLWQLPSSNLFAKFTNALVKSRPLKEIGAEQVGFISGLLMTIILTSCQLLIDLQALKAALLRIPGETLMTSKYVSKSKGRDPL